MPIYGKVESEEDISRINCIIRDEMLEADEESKLSELKKRSDYLCTLTFSPFWKKKFKDKIQKLQETAIVENRVSVKEANIISKFKGFDKTYHPWKREMDIEEELKKIPESIIDELSKNALTLQLDPKTLEEIRNLFCEIRKALVLCEDEDCLKKLKRGVDIISLLPYLDKFTIHFDKDLLKKIDELIIKEKNRTIELLNIIATVNGWDSYFGTINADNFDENIEESLEKLLEEEEKSETYIPTEAKYKGMAKVLWLVYYHPKRKREYAKRIYFPAEFKDLKIEGPKEFENRFGNKVWGIQISYKSKVQAATIKIRGKIINLPERWIERKKVIALPKIAQNIRLLEEKPKSAMDIY